MRASASGVVELLGSCSGLYVRLATAVPDAFEANGLAVLGHPSPASLVNANPALSDVDHSHALSSCVGLHSEVAEGREELRRLAEEKPHIREEFRRAVRRPSRLSWPND
jgi:hypothetical protein